MNEPIVVDIILTTHGEFSSQITAYNMRPATDSRAHERRPMPTEQLKFDDTSLLTLNMIMFNETGKSSLVSKKFGDALRASADIYDRNKTLFNSEMLDTLNGYHTSTLAKYVDIYGPIITTENTGFYEMYPNIKSIPQKTYMGLNRWSGASLPPFAIYSSDERIIPMIVKNISEQGDELSLMQIILGIQSEISFVNGYGKNIVINIIDMSCNALKERLNARISMNSDRSIIYTPIGKGKKHKRTKRKNIKHKKIRRKTKRN